ncbi:glutathione S-transferase 1-like [Anticarsia gemmatalis]|uniref:glutathione S-transferase 1-like n=1 Tax=Anticarsia gemmatalis TaxID=129554 RepID=UPI003F75D90A
MPTILYKADASPTARAAMMIVDILGLNFDQRDCNPVLREQDTPELKKKNPMRTIPLLDEGDYWLADSHAIMIYLLEKYGKPEHAHLYPKDPRKRGTIHQRLFFDCGILFPRMRSVMAPTYGGRLGEMTKHMIANIVDAYSKLEDYLSEHKYIADDEMTIADISIMTSVGSLNGLVPIDEKRFPKLKKWFDTMNATDYGKKINVPGSEQHAEGLKALMAFNKYNQTSKL